MTEEERLIQVPVLARVEGEAALEIAIRAGRLADLRLRIYEPPRLFEKLLEGRSFADVPDAVARICGICPVAYQMSAVRAIESAFGIVPTPEIEAMRRLYYCGEWIESHALHIHLLALPDYYGVDSVIALAAIEPAIVRRGLALQALGNDILRLLGGRSVHPVGACVGGFYRAPEEEDVRALAVRVDRALEEAEALVHFCARVPVPKRTQDFVCISVGDGDRYPVLGDRIVASEGIVLDLAEFDSAFEETQRPHSTALYCHFRGRPYLVGPLARMNLHGEKLPEVVRACVRAAKLSFPSANMFHSMAARAVEIFYALTEARRLLAAYRRPERSRVSVAPRAGSGVGATEAPRGMLWHRYSFDAAGRVLSARIVPPTSQNQARIEEDLRFSLEALGLERPDEDLRAHAEQVIRNYDPCISCATHFLRLEVTR